MEQSLKPILINIAAKSDADQLLACADAVSACLYNTKEGDYKKVIDKSLNADFAQVLKNALDEIPDASKINEFLISLKNEVQKLKVIKLTIAFSPTIDSIKTISAFIKEKFGEGFIMEIEQDPEILGGAIIVLDGKYQDFSLKKQLNEVFEKKKAEIVKLL